MNLAEIILSHIRENKNEAQIVFKGSPVSWKDVIEKTTCLHHSFYRKGIRNDFRCLMIMSDSPEFVYTFLALISIGAIPIPLSPMIKESDLAFVIQDSRPFGVIVDSDQFSRLSAFLCKANYTAEIIINHKLRSSQKLQADNNAKRISCLETFPAQHAGAPVCYYQKKEQSIAFWQYTSGTTGKPKAVQHTQKVMLENTCLFAKATLGIKVSDRIMSVPKMYFGYGLGNSLFFPLITGASVLLDDSWFSVEATRKNMQTFCPTIFFGVPKVYALILKTREEADQHLIKKIRLFFSAGSTLPEQINSQWKTAFDKFIINGIGNTEMGHVFLCNNPGKVDPCISGYGMPGYKIKLNDLTTPEKTITECGQIGELCISPPGNTLSTYWENEEANKQKFKEGWYYSGDLCVLTGENSYKYCGRKDDLFKVNGRWVNPGEIESVVLSLLYEIDECSMVECMDNDGLSIAILFIAAPENRTGLYDEEKLRAQLADKLETYKVPQKIFAIKEFPKNNNGKVDRKALKIFYKTNFCNNTH